MRYRTNTSGVAGLIGILIMVAVFLAAIFGWVFNIVEIFNTVNLPINGMFILRCVGIFIPPLGAVLGYL